MRGAESFEFESDLKGDQFTFEVMSSEWRELRWRVSDGISLEGWTRWKVSCVGLGC